MMFIVPWVSSQTAPAHEDDNLYAIALRASIVQMEREWGHIGYSGLEDQTPPDYRHMMVRKDAVLTDTLSNRFGEHSVEYLDDDALIQRYKKLRKSFAVLRIEPIRNAGNDLRIQVTVYWVSYKNNRLRLALSAWSDVHFHYDCSANEFNISSVKLGGI